MWRRRNLAAAAGIVGPVVFTASWLASGQRQAGYSILDEHISGLAAADARDPYLLTVGFVTLGACTVLFARELRRQLRETGGGAGPGPAVLQLAGWSAVVAAWFRRDHLLLAPPDLSEDWQQSWVNDVHDVASLVVYTCSVVAPILLALRFRNDPAWKRLSGVAYASSAVSLVLMAWFNTETARPGNGVVQRVMVSVPLLFMVLTALHMLRRSRSGALAPSAAGSVLRQEPHGGG